MKNKMTKCKMLLGLIVAFVLGCITLGCGATLTDGKATVHEFLLTDLSEWTYQGSLMYVPIDQQLFSYKQGLHTSDSLMIELVDVRDRSIWVYIRDSNGSSLTQKLDTKGNVAIYSGDLSEIAN